MRSRIGLIAVAAMAWIPAPGLAQPRPAVRLTLEEAQTRALGASHRLAEAAAREAAARAQADARGASDTPMVTAIAGYTRTNNVPEFAVPGPDGRLRVIYPNVPDNYRSRLDLQWPIYTGGRLDALERAARAEAAAVSAETATARADLRLEVARAFWAVVTASATVDVLERGVARAEAHVEDVRARFEAGLIPPNEGASARAQASRARLLLIEARNQRALAAADLARLIGAEPDQAVEPVADLAPAAQPGPLSTLVVEARASRSERQVLQHRIQAAEQQHAAAAAAHRPAIGVSGGVDYARPNPRIFPRAAAWQESWDAGVQVSWPLWDGGRMAADVAQTSALASAARARLADVDALIALEVRQRTLDIESGVAAVSASDDGIRAAQEARRVVGERYRAGVITQIEVLDAEFALLQAELDRTRALAGVRLAEARLARALGR
jgi:outer membrane protein TolC